MHFAVGMAGAGGLSLLGCTILGRGWRWTPVAMTLGGIWAIVPDLPRLFVEDFPNLPFASVFGSKSLQVWLNEQGNWFFLHRVLDEQPRELALHGLFGILVMYNLAIAGLLLLSRRAHPGRALPQHAWADPASKSPQSTDVVGRINQHHRAG